MSKKLQLSIPAPCHENWDAMTPVEKARPDDPVGRGKFCGSCQKQVVDFSNMNDRQVAEFFKKPSTGSVCGRFMTDQLERDIGIPKKRIPWIKYFFQFVIPAFLVSIKATSQKTQGKLMVTTVTTDTLRRPLDMKVGMVVRPICTKPFKGDTIITPVITPTIVSIKAAEPIKADASICKENGSISTIRGNVSIRMGGVRSIKTSDAPLIVVDGMPQITFSPGKLDPKTIDSVSILKGNAAMAIYGPKGVNGVILITTKKEVKNAPLMPDIIDDKHTATLKVFPNPVESGSSLNIEIKETEEGYYALQLLNQSGQSMHQQEIWIDAEARLLNIDIPAMAAGTYFLSLTNKKSGKRITEKIIIQ